MINFIRIALLGVVALGGGAVLISDWFLGTSLLRQWIDYVRTFSTTQTIGFMFVFLVLAKFLGLDFSQAKSSDNSYFCDSNAEEQRQREQQEERDERKNERHNRGQA